MIWKLVWRYYNFHCRCFGFISFISFMIQVTNLDLIFCLQISKTKTISSACIYNVYKSRTIRRGLLKSTISTITILEWINDYISCFLNINETIYNMQRRKLSCLADNITSMAIDKSTQLNVLSRQHVKLLSLQVLFSWSMCISISKHLVKRKCST